MSEKSRRNSHQQGGGGRDHGGHQGGGAGQQHSGLSLRDPLGAQNLIGNTGLREFLQGGGTHKLDALADLTPSQREWIVFLQQIEQLNPDASIEDLAMALSLKVWNANQMWDENGKSQYPGLILDYQGGDGYKSVVFPEDDRGGKGTVHDRLKHWASDKKGGSTNVNHVFPAVAAQAGRSRISAEYASLMTTSGGDTLQNLGHMAVSALDGKFGDMLSHFSSGEYSGNLRAEEIADELRDGDGSLSEQLLDQFRKENQD